jgi:DNA polymerase III alpha subunit
LGATGTDAKSGRNRGIHGGPTRLDQVQKVDHLDGSFSGNSTRRIRVAVGSTVQLVDVQMTGTTGTASGVVFVTLEDETGNVNVVVWRDLADRQRRELLGARLLGVHGILERDGDVLHLIAGRLTDHSALLGTLETASRDFH